MNLKIIYVNINKKMNHLVFLEIIHYSSIDSFRISNILHHHITKVQILISKPQLQQLQVSHLKKIHITCTIQQHIYIQYFTSTNIYHKQQVKTLNLLPVLLLKRICDWILKEVVI